MGNIEQLLGHQQRYIKGKTVARLITKNKQHLDQYLQPQQPIDQTAATTYTDQHTYSQK
jgi:hypothetical protein